ncbi:MAG: glycosyltransferase family 1 protein [Candidatus Saccharimonadales bacterium]
MAKKHIVVDARIRMSSTGTYMDNLLKYLQQVDTTNNYTILLSPKDNWGPETKNFNTVVCKFKPYSFNILDQVFFSLWLNKLKPDLVHFTITPQEPVFFMGKRITTTHDLTMFDYVRAGRLPKLLHFLRMQGYRFLMWQSHKKAKYVIVPSEYVRDDVYKKYLFVKRKLKVTLESSEPPIKGKAEKLENIDKPFILHVGSPFPHKNIERLIEAFKILKSKNKNLTLVLAGKREYYFDKLEESLVGDTIRDSIVIPGFVSSGELKWLYENTECYVLPSLSEGFGLPGLEAMAHGCPLVSSNATCLPEIYGSAAEYFNPLDTEDMAAKISKVINGQKTKETLVAAGHRQLKKYSWKKMASETLDIYNLALKD